MAAVTARAVMGTKRVAPCPAETGAPIESSLKEPPPSDLSSWWPSLLSPSPSPHAETAGTEDAVPPFVDDGNVSKQDDPTSALSEQEGSSMSDEVVVTTTNPIPRQDTTPAPPTLALPRDDEADLPADVARSSLEQQAETETVTSPVATAASLLSAAALADGGMVDMEADACSICLDSFSKADPAVLTKCNHEYHFQCVLEWAQRKEECPMCWQPLQLSDPSSQELLDACARERKERAAALEAQANLLNSAPHPVVFVRHAHGTSRTSRQRSASPWHVQADTANTTNHGSATPPRSMSSFFGLGHRHKGGSHHGSPSHGASASADAIPLGTEGHGSSHHHSWFKRHGSSSRGSSRPTVVQGSAVSTLSSTLSAPGTGAAGAGAGTSRVQGSMSSFSTAPSPGNLNGGGNVQHVNRDAQTSGIAIPAPHHSPLRPFSSLNGSSVSSSLGGSSPSWRSKFSLRHSRAPGL